MGQWMKCPLKRQLTQFCDRKTRFLLRFRHCTEHTVQTYRTVQQDRTSQSVIYFTVRRAHQPHLPRCGLLTHLVTDQVKKTKLFNKMWIKFVGDLSLYTKMLRNTIYFLIEVIKALAAIYSWFLINIYNRMERWVLRWRHLSAKRC